MDCLYRDASFTKIGTNGHFFLTFCLYVFFILVWSILHSLFHSVFFFPRPFSCMPLERQREMRIDTSFQSQGITLPLPLCTGYFSPFSFSGFPSYRNVVVPGPPYPPFSKPLVRGPLGYPFPVFGASSRQPFLFIGGVLGRCFSSDVHGLSPFWDLLSL